MGRYSYSQPTDSSHAGGEYSTHASEYSETEDLIRRDQEELSLKYGETPQYTPHYPLQYPPQPEVEFGFPQVCYCGAAPKIATSRVEPGRRYYTCEHVDDGECHVWKWWDVAVMEEMRARDKRLLQLEEKVDYLNLASDFETDEKVRRLEQLVCDLSEKKSSFKNAFEVFIGVMLIVSVLLGLLIVFK